MRKWQVAVVMLLAALGSWFAIGTQAQAKTYTIATLRQSNNRPRLLVHRLRSRRPLSQLYRPTMSILAQPKQQR
ncbi:hypothetical protein WP50_34730, partial [Lactiplantibacillus plantarum]